MPRPRLMLKSIFCLMKIIRRPTELFSLSHHAVSCIRDSLLNLVQQLPSKNNEIITAEAAGKFRFFQNNIKKRARSVKKLPFFY